jgi:hypothetical protein
MRKLLTLGCTVLALGVAVYCWALVTYWQTETCGQVLIIADLASIAILLWHWVSWGRLLCWKPAATRVKHETQCCLLSLVRHSTRYILARFAVSLVIFLTGLVVLTRASSFEPEEPTLQCIQANSTAPCLPCSDFTDTSNPDHAMIWISLVAILGFAGVPTMLNLVLLGLKFKQWCCGAQPQYHGGDEQPWDHTDVEMATT